MLGLGWGEILIVAAVALVVVGPERLPRLLRDLGRMYGQARRAADELRRSFMLEADRQDAEERYAKLQERRKEAAEARRKALDAGQLDPDDGPFTAGAGETDVTTGTLTDDGLTSEDGFDAEEAFGDPRSREPGDPDSDPNAIDPEAPHPIQAARSERP